MKKINNSSDPQPTTLRLRSVQAHNPQLYSGFTIIELLISIAVVAVLLSVSFAGYAKLDQRQTLISAGQNLKNIIRDAQSRVFNNEIDCNSCTCSSSGSSSFNGWTVDFDQRNIYGSCGVTPTIFNKLPFSISPDVIITPYMSPPPNLLFKNNPPSVNSAATICLSYKNLDSTYYIVRVKETGAVSDEGSLLNACPSPTP